MAKRRDVPAGPAQRQDLNGKDERAYQPVSQHLQDRNDQIRRLYAKKYASFIAQGKSEKDSEEEAILELLKDFRSYKLSFEYIRTKILCLQSKKENGDRDAA